MMIKCLPIVPIAEHPAPSQLKKMELSTIFDKKKKGTLRDSFSLKIGTN